MSFPWQDFGGTATADDEAGPWSDFSDDGPWNEFAGMSDDEVSSLLSFERTPGLSPAETSQLQALMQSPEREDIRSPSTLLPNRDVVGIAGGDVAMPGGDELGIMSTPTGYLTTPFVMAGRPINAALQDAGTSLAMQPGYGGNLWDLFNREEPLYSSKPLPYQETLAEVSKTHPGIATVGKLAAATVETSPMLAIMPQGALGKLAAAGFTAEMIGHVPDAAARLGEEMGKPPAERDADALTTALSEIIMSAGLAPFTGAHATGRIVGERIAPKREAIRELAKALKSEPLDIPGRSPTAIEQATRFPRQRVTSEPFLQPGIPRLADAALREAQQVIQVPGERALDVLRREVAPPRIEPAPTRLAERIEGGGEAPYGKTSFMREAEAPVTERTRNALQQEAAQPVRPVRQEPVQGAVEVPAEVSRGPTDVRGDQGRIEAQAPPLMAEIQSVAAMDAPTFLSTIRGREGGLTGDAYRLGQRITSRAEVDALKAAGDALKTEMDVARKAGDFNTAMAIAMKRQYLREAHETATGQGSAGHHFRQADPNFQPKFPEAEPFQKPAEPPTPPLTPEKQEAIASRSSVQREAIMGQLAGMFGLEQKRHVEAMLDNPNPETAVRIAFQEHYNPKHWEAVAQDTGGTPQQAYDSSLKRGVDLLVQARRALGIETKPTSPLTPESELRQSGGVKEIQTSLDAEVARGKQGIGVVVKDPIQTGAYGMLKKVGAKDYQVTSPGGSQVITFGSEKVESIKSGVITLKGHKPKQPTPPAPLKAKEGVTAEPTPTAARPEAESLVQKLESLKFKQDNEGRLYSLPHPDALAAIGKSAWNGAIDVAILGVKAGKTVKEAVESAIQHIRYNAKNFNEAQVRANLESILADEAPRPAAPAATKSQTGRQVTAGLEDVYQIFEPSKKPGVPLRERGTQIAEAVRTGFSSKFRPVNKLAEDIAKSYGTGKPKDIAGIMEQLKGSQGRGEAQIYRFDKDVSSLVKGQEKDFNAYMFLRRSLDRLKQDQADLQRAAAGEEVGALNRRQVSQYTIPELEAKLATLERTVGPETLPKFEKAAEGYQRYMDDALRLQVESGRMSPEVYRAIKEGNEFYAPFKVMKYLEENARPEGSGRRIDTPAEFTKAMKGIEDPNFKLGDMLGAARQSILMSRILADKNMAMRHVAELAPFDTQGLFIRKLAPKAEVPAGWEAVNVLENGRPTRYAARPEVAEALQLYGPAGMGFGTRLMSSMSVPFRAGATAFNLPFQVSNLLADVPRQGLVSKYGLRTPADVPRWLLVDYPSSLISSMKGNVFGSKDKLYLDFLDSGVSGGTVQEFLTPGAFQFREPTTISKSRKLASSVLNTIPNFAKAIEETSKIVGVKRAMRMEQVINPETGKLEGIGSGKALAQQIPEAITELRRFSGSPDFGRSGKITDQWRLNLIYMFLNARIQGAVADVGRLTGRDGKATAARTWFKVGTAVGLPTAYLYYLNNRPEYREDYASRPDHEKENYWLIPKDSFITTEDGEKIRDYWRIPKRESAKWIGNMTERVMDFARDRDPESFKEFGEQMVEDIFPVNIQGDSIPERLESVGASLNPLFKAPLELATGRDLYRHRQLVPERMKKASPELQFTDRTAEAFKVLSEKMPEVAPEFMRSPIMLENLTRNLTAGLLTQFLPRKPVEGRKGFEQTPLLQRFQAIPITDREQFNEVMEELEREAADESIIRMNRARKLLDDNKGKTLPQIVEANRIDDPKLIRKMADLWVAKENGATGSDRQLLALPVKQRAQYVAEKLRSTPKDQQPALIQDLARKRILSEGVIQALSEMELE